MARKQTHEEWTVIHVGLNKRYYCQQSDACARHIAKDATGRGPGVTGQPTCL